MRARLILLVLVTLEVLSISALPSPMVYTPHVQVVVYADKLASQIRSCLTHELCQLPGVTIVDREPEWIIDVIGFQPINRAERVIGYALVVLNGERTMKRWSEFAAEQPDMAEAGRALIC
jgi:hypothetical protein